MRQICMSGSMSGVWKRNYGRATKAPPDERGGNRHARPNVTAPHPDSTGRRPLEHASPQPNQAVQAAGDATVLAKVKVRSSPCSPCSARAPVRGSAWLRSSPDLRCDSVASWRCRDEGRPNRRFDSRLRRGSNKGLSKNDCWVRCSWVKPPSPLIGDRCASELPKKDPRAESWTPDQPPERPRVDNSDFARKGGDRKTF